jgi:uncharacterized protein YkwD
MGTANITRMRAGVLATVAIAAAAIVPAHASGTAGGTATATSNCAGADAFPGQVSRQQIRSATLCLINAERRARGLRGLRHNRRLGLAAQRHANDMARNDYFSHDSLDGRDFVDRIVRAGYVSRRSGGWSLGENLAWGSGIESTPRRIVAAWMGSEGHRYNILRRVYREIGFGLARDTPVAGLSNGATYATSFGRRR